MTDTKLIEALSNASSLELFELSNVIDRLLADPRRNAREANGLARRARTADPRLPLPWVVAGMLLEPLGEKDRAAQLYRHALTLDPECADAQTALDRLLSASP